MVADRVWVCVILRLVKLAVFSTHSYDRASFEAANVHHGHELTYFQAQLNPDTAQLAHEFPAVCAFVNDVLQRPTLEQLVAGRTRLVVLRSAGFNHVDVVAAAELGLTVARVPSYSPRAVAEHAVGLILTLNRKFHRAYSRVREGNFALSGLEGFDIHARTVGVIGTGQIGRAFCQIMRGFGCRVLAYDVDVNTECVDLGVEYVDLETLYRNADIISLHCPLTPQTRHLIDAHSLSKMKPGAMLINTGRGALIDTPAAIAALKTRHLGYLGLDVYEEEETLFFQDLSAEVIQDDVFMRLLTFPNVVVTAHQGFFTHEALENIASTTLQNVTAFETGRGALHRVST